MVNPTRRHCQIDNCAVTVSDKKLSRPLTYPWPRSTTSEIARFFTNSPTAWITRSMSPRDTLTEGVRWRRSLVHHGGSWCCVAPIGGGRRFLRVFVFALVFVFILCLYLYLYFYFYSMLASGVILHRLVMVKVAVD